MMLRLGIVGVVLAAFVLAYTGSLGLKWAMMSHMVIGERDTCTVDSSEVNFSLSVTGPYAIGVCNQIAMQTEPSIERFVQQQGALRSALTSLVGVASAAPVGGQVLRVIPAAVVSPDPVICQRTVDGTYTFEVHDSGQHVLGSQFCSGLQQQ